MVILGDPAYPALPWLMKPYQETVHTTSGQKAFNYRESRARMVLENSFGRLKGQLRCLLKRLDVKMQNVPHIVNLACVVLHNMCEMYGDNCLMEWVDDPSTFPCDTSHSPIHVDTPNNANIIHDAIMQHLTSTQ